MEPRRGPLLPVVRELVAEWLSLDGRLPRTLAALARPGRLTREYLDGRSAAYLRPFRLYMLASLVLFSSVLTLRAPDADEVDVYIGGELVSAGADNPGGTQITFFSPDSAVERWMVDHAADRLDRLRHLPPQELLNAFFSAMRRVLPAGLILFLPFLALALKLLYLRTGTLYVDHLVFAVHFQCALFAALALVWLLRPVFGINRGPSLLLYVLGGVALLVVYLPLALRRVYRQARWLTALKAIVLIACYLQLLGLSLGPAVALAVLYL